MDDAKDAALATLTSQMFAEPIATGEIVVTDPPEVAAPPAPVAVAPVAVAAEPEPVAAVAPVAVAAEPEPVAVENVPTFKPKLDDDLKALLDEPDFEEEARAEVAAEVEENEYAYEDPDTAARERAKDKRIAHLESQLVAKSKKGWIEEAKRAYPDLARLLPGEIESIDASSRRGFIRVADGLNTRYQTVLAPTLARLEAERAAIASGAVATAREEVANAWGRPAADTLPPIDAAQQEALLKARKAGDLTAGIKALMNDPSRPPLL